MFKTPCVRPTMLSRERTVLHYLTYINLQSMA